MAPAFDPLARPSVRPRHRHGLAPDPARWVDAPGAAELEENPLRFTRPVDPYDPETHWALRWKHPVTGRFNYVLRAADRVDVQGTNFDEAARYGEELGPLRAHLVSDVLYREGPWQQLPVLLCMSEQLRATWSAPNGASGSPIMTGDEQLKDRILGCSLKGQPGEAEQKAALWWLQPGLTFEGMSHFQRVAAALPLLARFRDFARAEALTPEEVVLLLFGFRKDEVSDALLAKARAFGCPEARFPTRRQGRVHLCGGVAGVLTTTLWDCMPIPNGLGPATLYTRLLEELGALPVARALAATTPEPPLEVAAAIMSDKLEIPLKRALTDAEREANEWFWEQSHRPAPADQALVRRLAGRATVPLDESDVPDGLTRRAQSRRNRPFRPRAR